MAVVDLVISGSRVMLPPLGLRPASVAIDDGMIVGISDSPDANIEAREWVDAGDDVVMPGFVDSHVHLNEPGRSEWEGFASGTRAAALAGITTVIDMPLNSSPVTTTVDALRAKVDAASGAAHVDFGVWAGVVDGDTPVNELLDAGACGFKCFLVESGLAEFGSVDASILRRVMPAIAARHSTLLVHAELPGPLLQAPAGAEERRRYASYLASRPDDSEVDAIRMVIDLSRETRCRVHIVHVATASALGLLRDAKAEGVRITCETCPHYLLFDGDHVADGSTLIKCAPPIRGSRNRAGLWEGVREGVIDMIVSDHSPCPPGMKCLETGDFFEAWGGISSLQFGPGAMWRAMRERGLELTDLTRLMTIAPARVAGLFYRKRQLIPGRDADVIVWDPDRESRVHPGMIEHRHKVTPYDGRDLLGSARHVFVRGHRVVRDGVLEGEPIGRLVTPQRTPGGHP